MVNVYSADQNERMERLDQISSLVGNYLLRGYKMLADECGTCRTVILEDRHKKKLCVGCEIVDKTPDNEQPASQNPQSSVTMRDINPSDMSREQLYTMLSQQAATRDADVRRTPSPPARLVQAATTAVNEPAVAERDNNTCVTDAIDQTILKLCEAIQNTDHSNLSQSTHIKQYSEAIFNIKRSR